MRALVTGNNNSMLNSAIVKVFNEDEIIMPGSLYLDIRNIKQVMSYANQKFDIILHTAAETDHMACESIPSEAYLTNFVGTQNIVELAKRLNTILIYIGTAGIFDGAKEVYTERDIPNPINHYGRSKYYGECAVQLYPQHYIVRSGWAMGGGPAIDKKFINKVFQQIEAGNTTLYGITDIYGTPTYTMDFAQTIKNIIEGDCAFGIYHASGFGKASRFDVLRQFVHYLNLDKFVDLVPMTYNEYHAKFPLQCPYTKSEVLSIDKIRGLGVSAMRPWQLALEEYAKEF